MTSAHKDLRKEQPILLNNNKTASYKVLQVIEVHPFLVAQATKHPVIRTMVNVAAELSPRLRGGWEFAAACDVLAARNGLGLWRGEAAQIALSLLAEESS